MIPFHHSPMTVLYQFSLCGRSLREELEGFGDLLEGRTDAGDKDIKTRFGVADDEAIDGCAVFGRGRMENFGGYGSYIGCFNILLGHRRAGNILLTCDEDAVILVYRVGKCGACGCAVELGVSSRIVKGDTAKGIGIHFCVGDRYGTGRRRHGGGGGSL